MNETARRRLPKWTEHGEHDKTQPLNEASVDRERLEPVVWSLIESHAESLGRAPRILDFGCGRGGTVALLHRRGFRAWGVDVEPLYMASGAGYFPTMTPVAVLSLLDADGRSAFPDGHFDIVLSDQVLEHVPDIDLFAREVARVTAPGGVGLHILPARHRPIEPHYHLPLVHWLPKGELRRKAIHLLLSIGVGTRRFAEHSIGDRTRIIADFADGETYYRSLGEISRAFARTGASVRSAARDKLLRRGGLATRVAALPLVGGLAARLYSRFGGLYVLTSMPATGL